MDPAQALARLKHMVAWTTDPQLSAEDVDMLLRASRRVDSSGNGWTSPSWVPTFNLAWAAREAWAWKAGACTDRYKVVMDGAELNRQQVHQHCEKMAEYYEKRMADAPTTLRMTGNLVLDRTGPYTSIPWWWELTA